MSKALNPNPSLAEKGSTVAVEAIKLLSTEMPERLATIEHNLDIRIQAAQHFLNLRKFAKLDALSHCWPELAHLLMASRAALIRLEECECISFL